MAPHHREPHRLPKPHHSRGLSPGSWVEAVAKASACRGSQLRVLREVGSWFYGSLFVRVRYLVRHASAVGGPVSKVKPSAWSNPARPPASPYAR